MASILKVDTIQDQSGNNIINENADTITIGASGDTITVPTGASLTVPNGKLTGQNYPAFEAYLSSSQSISDAVRTTININTESFDTDGCFDNVTNYRFTPNVAGKYFCYANALLDAVGTSNLNVFALYFLKNGATTVAERSTSFQSNPAQYFNASIYKVIEFNGTTDHLILQAYIDDVSGSPSIGGNATDSRTNFGAFRIGA